MASIFKAMLVQSILTIQLIPEYQSSYYWLSLSAGSNFFHTIPFPHAFSALPKVALAWNQLDSSQGITQALTLNTTQIRINDFQITITCQMTLNSYSIRWLAFLDDNIYTQFGEVNQTIASQNTIIQIQLLNSLSYIPTAAYFLSGILLQTPSITQYQFKFQISSISRTKVGLEVNLLPGFIVQYFSYQLVYGSPNYLDCGSLQSATLGLSLFGVIDNRTKVTVVGFNGFMESGKITLRVTNTFNQINVTTWSYTSLTSYVLSYFNYMPCPLYCTTCSVAAPNCDGCSASTQRTGSSCTSCQQHTYLPSPDSLDCLDCALYCDSCSGSAINCTVCLPISLRIGLPSCTTCPSQMFVQAGMVNCQTCSIYCNECSVISTNCTACQANTLRSNPPNCSCPSQFHQIYNTAVCQPCLLYCNNCLDYSSDCIACSSVSMRIYPPNCTTCPQNMYVNQDTCTLCDSTCQTCDQSGCLNCLTNQYLNNLNKCADCPSHCLTCDINTCYSCTDNCIQCDLISCLKCPVDNYYSQGTICIKCDDDCSQCDSQGCLTCIGTKILINNKCQCQSPCLTCDFIQCLTCISTDYRLNNSVCEYCPSRCMACDSKENCLQGPQNCNQGILVGDSKIQCNECKSSYYLNNNSCLPCQPQCLTCSSLSYDCISCRFPEIHQSECQKCESQIGFYSDYTLNKCYTVCGDGLMAENEECDDGNTINKDGCTNCQIDDGFMCSGMVCQQFIYPIPTLNQILIYDSVYNSTKSFMLSYNEPLVIQTIQMSLQVIDQIDFTLNFSQINSQQFILVINLKDQCLNSQVKLTFLDPSEIVSETGVSQQLNFVQCSMSYYLFITSSDKSVSKSTDMMMQCFFIIFLIIVGLSILCGGLNTFWNLLDLLQMISYLKYINTIKPYVLDLFFNQFGFLQFQNLPLNQFLQGQNYVQSMIDTKQFINPPEYIYNDAYTCSTIINIIPIANVVLTAILIYYSAKLVNMYIRSMKFNEGSYKSQFTLKAMNFIFALKVNIQKTTCSLIKSWQWSGIIRLFSSSVYDISFMIVLGIYGQSYTSSNYIVQIDFILTFSSIVIFLTSTFFIISLNGYLNITLVVKENYLGSIYEGLKLHISKKYYNTILIYKKAIFIVFLVLLYNEPLFQILSILLLQGTLILCLLWFDPIANSHEKIKQIICENLILIAEISLAILVIDDEFTLFIYDYRKFCGLICVLSLLFIIIIQLVIDSIQQYKIYYNKYYFLRKIVNQLKCKYQTVTRKIELKQNIL